MKACGLSKAQIEELSERLLSRLEGSEVRDEKGNLNIPRLLELMGWTIVHRGRLAIVEASESACCDYQVLVRPDEKEIWVDSHAWVSHKSFLLAHALGHVLLHVPLGGEE